MKKRLGLTARHEPPVGKMVPLSTIEPNPNQLRSTLGDLVELVASIRDKGVLEPILVRPRPGSEDERAPSAGVLYRIISGERRFRAAQEAGLYEVPVIEMDVSEEEALEIALIENLQQKDLTPFEEAEGFRLLAESHGYTHEEIAAAVGKSRTVITESLSLLQAPPWMRETARTLEGTEEGMIFRYKVAQGAASTRAFLHARGLDVEPEDLQVILEEALNGMRCILFPVDPAADLPAAETAALRRGGFTLEPADSGPASALARTAAEYAALRETSLTTTETARRLKVKPSRVRHLLAARKLYGLQVKGAWKIPAFQFEGERLLPGLEEVVPALPKDLHPVGIYHWFTEPNPDLASEDGKHRMSPREWLLAGYPPQAVAVLAADLDSL